MACKYFIDGKQLSEQEVKSYISDKYIDSKDIKFTTLDDIANILAYSNSKIILDGWKIEYSTPLGNKYDTLEEVNQEIRNLANNILEPIQLTQEQEIAIDSVWNEYPVLKEIFKGNKSLYQHYLNSIFPGSEEKDIYLHQTNIDFKDIGFDKNKIGSNTNNNGYYGYGFYFVKDTGTPIDGGWGGFASAPIAYGEIEMPVILNIKKIKNGITTIQKDPKKLTAKLKKEGYDSINAPDGLVVFEPEQIHILGSKQDIQQAKQFVKNNVEIDLSGVKVDNIRKPITASSEIQQDVLVDEFENTTYIKKNGEWFDEETGKKADEDLIVLIWNSNISDNNLSKTGLEGFLQKNKEYEQSKEIIEQWKKENNIQYDPEEVYSRGQGFYSSIGAYSNLELDLLLKNLIQHIQDNKKAGGEFTISAFTKPIGKRLKHIEGTGDRVRFVIYPKSEHIKWAAPTDVFSGSVWDASEKVNKDKKSELLGVSYTKYPSLSNVNTVQPNLASIVDDLAHHHNELGIVLTGNNFRLEYDEDIPYTTKKIIDGINKILDQKYGKLVKPEISKKVDNKVEYIFGNDTFNTLEEAKKAVDLIADTEANEVLGFDYSDIKKRVIPQGIQPTQTNETLKESIESVKDRVYIDDSNYGLLLKNYNQAQQGIIPEYYSGYTNLNGKLESKVNVFALNLPTIKNEVGMWQKDEDYNIVKDYIVGETENVHGVKFWVLSDEFKQEALNSYKKPIKPEKEYTEQALINTKIAKLKEIAKKYPRSLITSKVVPINPNMIDNSEIQYSKTNNNTEQQTPEDLLTKMIDSGAIQKDCTGGFKAKDGIRGKFTKGSQWEIAKDLKGYPSHAQGGVDIKLGKDGFSFTGKDGIIKAKYGLVLPVIKAQSGVVVNNDDKNKSKYRPSIGDKVGDNYITDNNIVNKFKRYLTESSITDNPSEFLKNVASKKNPFGYYGGLPFSTAAKAGKWKIDRNDKEGYYSLYNYNPFGDSFYDRVYDKDIKKYDYDENTKKEIQKHYKSGAIKPVIDYEKNELGWEYNDYSKLQDKTIKDKKFVQDWFNNPEAKKRYIKSGGTEEQWKENIDNINKNLSTLKIKESLKIPDLYTGEEALYSPYYHSVLDHFENAYTHEITHGSHAAKNKHSSSIIKDVVKNHSLRKDSYYQSDEEVYSRIMQIRKDFDIKPSDKIDKEYLKQKLLEQKSKYKDIDELFRYIDSKGIIKLLNSLADNSNKSTNNNLV